MKHAVLLALLTAMKGQGGVRLVETHAGAGLYDLHGDLARRTNEAEAGVGQLMAADELPDPLAALKAVVARENPGGDLRFYPGSPLVALGALGRGDRYIGCEIRPEDRITLDTLLRERGGPGQARVLETDGYAALDGLFGRGDLVLIDPPYERGDDYDQAAEAVALCVERGAGAALWAPVKDLETLDALVRRLEALRPRRLLLAEVRLRSLANPMKMNGSAMLLVDAPDVEAEARAICAWTATHCGEAGAKGMVSNILPG